jgi:hypothetical protein
MYSLELIYLISFDDMPLPALGANQASVLACTLDADTAPNSAITSVA